MRTIFTLILTFTLTGVSVVFLCPSLLAEFLLAMACLTSLRRSTWPVRIDMNLSALSAVALYVPPYSSKYSQRLNIFHYEDRDTGKAFGITKYSKEGIPSATEKAASFEQKQILPWSETRYLVTPAPFTPDPAPELVVLSDRIISGEREVRIRLRSPQGAQLFDKLATPQKLFPTVMTTKLSCGGV